MRQLQKVFSVVLLVSTIWMSQAYAAAGWFTCEVNLTGMYSSDLAVFRVTDLAGDPAFTAKNFYSNSPSNAKSMLAIALTSMTSGQPVLIFADPDLGLPTIYQIYLTEE